MQPPELDVRYVAKLARLALSDEEIETFQRQLAQVLGHVEQLRSVDVSHVDALAHASPVHNVFRADVERPGFTPAEALANAPKKANDLFIVTKVVE